MSALEEKGRDGNGKELPAILRPMLKKIKDAIRQIDLTLSDDAVTLYIARIWNEISQLPPSIHEDSMFQSDFEDLYRKTLQVILSIDWDKVANIQRTLLLTALDTCANKIANSKSCLAAERCCLAAERCRILCNMIKEPWSNFLLEFLNSTNHSAIPQVQHRARLYPTIGTEIVQYISAQPVDVITVRLSVLVKQKLEVLALNLARVCITCACIVGTEDKNLVLDYYVGLLLKFKLVDEFISKILSGLKVPEGLELLDRYLRFDTKAPPELLKQHGMRRASKTIINHFLSTVLLEEKVINSEDSMVFKLTKQWLQLHKAWDTAPLELHRQINSLAESAASTLHVFLICSAIQSELGVKCDLNSEMLQQIIRRLNESHNDVKKHIQTRDNLLQATESEEGPEVQEEREKLKQLVVEAEHRLAEEFELLSVLVRHCAPAYRECLLTAFSLRPTLEALQALEELAPLDDSGETDSLLGLTGDDIGCSSDVCDDLLIIINSARWQVLKWETKWTELKDLCTEYLKNPERSRYKREKLEFAKIPGYIDIGQIHEDRMSRRIRLKEQDEENAGIDEIYSDGEPKPKKVRKVSTSDSSDICDDSDIWETSVMVVSSSEGEDSPDNHYTPTPLRCMSFPSNHEEVKRVRLFAPQQKNKLVLSKLLSLRHNGSPAKECAPSLAGQNLQPKVAISCVKSKSYSQIVRNITSMDHFEPAPLNATVQVVQVGQGVPPSQTNPSPPVSQPPSDPPQAPQSSTNGPPSNAAPTEQLPKFQQVFGKNFQQAQQQPQPQQTPLPQPTPQPPPQQPQPQSTPVQPASSATQQTVQQIRPRKAKQLLDLHFMTLRSSSRRNKRRSCAMSKQGRSGSTDLWRIITIK